MAMELLTTPSIETEALEENGTCMLGPDEELAPFEIATLAIIFSVAFLSNSILLLALWRYSRDQDFSRMKILILHLCITDLSVAVFSVLPSLIWKVEVFFRGPDFLCRLVAYVQLLVVTASSYVLLATAVDRYVALCSPMHSLRWTKRRTHKMVAVAWLAAAVISTPQLYLWQMRELAMDRNCITCTIKLPSLEHAQAYVTFHALSIFIVPTLILVFTYGRICVVVWRATSQSSSDFLQRNTASTANPETSFLKSDQQTTGASQRATSSMTSSKLKTFKLTATVIVCFIVGNIPFFSVILCRAWVPESNYRENIGKAH